MLKWPKEKVRKKPETPKMMTSNLSFDNLRLYAVENKSESY